MNQLVCSGFEEFASSVHKSDNRVMLAGPEESSWWIRTVTFERLSVQTAQEGAANILHGASIPDTVHFLLALGGAPFSLNGTDFSRTSVGVLTPRQPFTTRAQGRNVWTTICVPPELASGLLTSGEHRQAHRWHDRIHHLRARPLEWRRLAGLVERITTPDSNARLHLTGDGARTIEDELMYALSLLLNLPSDTGSRRGGRPVLPRQLILDRALEWIHAHPDHPLRIADLSSAAGVSERTVRDVFVDYFGMGPLTYIRTWQLHRIRAALLEAEPGQATVTSVAMRLGVWDLDTMAGRYRLLFGERPGVTLRRKGIRFTPVEDGLPIDVRSAV